MRTTIPRDLRYSYIIQKNSNEKDISFDYVVGAGDDTLIVYGNASPLTVDLKDIFVSCRPIPSFL